MSEFLNRMNAQRALLRVVNSRQWREELFGLSSRAIDRWVSSNNLGADVEAVSLLRLASDQLSFLANKSQEQVSDKYRSAAENVERLAREIGEKLTG